MRVVHVANAYTPRSGGIRTTVHALGQGYRAAGHDFVLVVPGPQGSDEDLPWGRRITLQDLSLLRSPRPSPGCWRCLRRGGGRAHGLGQRPIRGQGRRPRCSRCMAPKRLRADARDLLDGQRVKAR